MNDMKITDEKQNCQNIQRKRSLFVNTSVDFCDKKSLTTTIHSVIVPNCCVNTVEFVFNMQHNYLIFK